MIPTSCDIWTMVEPHSLALAATRSGRSEVKNSTDGGMIPTSCDIWTMVEPHSLALAATRSGRSEVKNLTDVRFNTRRRELCLGRDRNGAGLNLRSSARRF